MQLRETDSYGEWVIRKLKQEAGGEANPLPAEVLTAARGSGLVFPALSPERSNARDPFGKLKLLPRIFGKEYCGRSAEQCNGTAITRRPFETPSLTFS